MPLTDKQGVPWAHSGLVRGGDKLKTDGGFTCMGEGEVKTVYSDPTCNEGWPLYIECDGGQHFLDGQLGVDGELVGLYPVS